MNIVVCIKQVPEVADAELEILDDGARIDEEDLVMAINEWDNYAVEEAIRLKEAHGGEVTVVSLGNEEAEDILRRALAMGADAAVLIDDEDFEGSDAMGIARGLHSALRERDCDLILAGAQSSDTGWGQVGVCLAELLGWPYATLAVGLERTDEGVIAERELENNTHERVALSLPALVTVQTGINTPRYVSVMGIRKVRRVGIESLDADELDLDAEDIGQEASSVESLTLELPASGQGAEMLTGNLAQICERTATIIRDVKGVLR